MHDARFERALLAGKLQLPRTSSFFFLSSLSLTARFLVSRYQRVASAFNQFMRDGLDMMGGADGEAIDRLLDDYLLSEEEAGDGLPAGSK